MNYWTEQSIELANQRNYLDQLFTVYPIRANDLREISEEAWAPVQEAFDNSDNAELIRSLLKFKLFPIKDSYVSFLRTDPTAIDRNPQTVARIGGMLHEMGADLVFDKCSQPKETNRQMGSLFTRWLKTGALGLPTLNKADFLATTTDAVLLGTDAELLEAAKSWGYHDTKGKGIDFVCRVNGNKVLGEAKFLTSEGGNQNNQFDDALRVVASGEEDGIVKIAVVDGVLYLKKTPRARRASQTLEEEDNSQMARNGYLFLTSHPEEYNIMSVLVLRDFLFSLPIKS